MSKFNQKNLNAGHRQRLRERFMASKESLPDYELVEMLLFLAFVRKDTKDLAKTLLNKFKTLKYLINADENQLRGVDGVGDSVICLIELVHEIFLRILKSNIKPEELKIRNVSSAIEYVKSKLGSMVTEYVLILFLNNDYTLVHEKIVSMGDLDSASVYKNMIITQATQNGSKSIVMIHNHPSGVAEPSDRDIQFTRELSFILSKVDIKLIDHIIVTKDDYFSFLETRIIK